MDIVSGIMNQTARNNGYSEWNNELNNKERMDIVSGIMN